MKWMTLICSIALMVAGCSGKNTKTNEEWVGLWEPIEVDKEMASVTKAGGEVTFTVTNYPGWWMSRVHAVDGDVETIYNSPKNLVEADWFTVSCPSNGTGLTVTVKKNDTYNARKISMEMTVGDAFTTVSVLQNCY